MASTDRKIRMTIVLENALYFSFHEKAQEIGATHNGIVRKLIRSWTSGLCPCKDERRRKSQ